MSSAADPDGRTRAGRSPRPGARASSPPAPRPSTRQHQRHHADGSDQQLQLVPGDERVDDVGVTDASALAFGASTVSGGLTANATGAITQSGRARRHGADRPQRRRGERHHAERRSRTTSPARRSPARTTSWLTDTNALALGASTVERGLHRRRPAARSPRPARSTVDAADDFRTPPVAPWRSTRPPTTSPGPSGSRASGGGAAAVDDTNDLTLAGSTSGGPLTATADDDLAVPGAASIAATGALRLVADDANPAAPAIGAGGITVGRERRPYRCAARSGSTGRGAATTRSRRTPPSTARPSPRDRSSSNSAREQWGVYSPAGTATAPFTFFYKDTDSSTPQANDHDAGQRRDLRARPGR